MAKGREGKGVCRPLSPEDTSQRLTAECSRKNKEDPCAGTMSMLPDPVHTVPFLSRLPPRSHPKSKALPLCIQFQGQLPTLLNPGLSSQTLVHGAGQAVHHCSPTQPVRQSQLRTKRVQEICPGSTELGRGRSRPQDCLSALVIPRLQVLG